MGHLLDYWAPREGLAKVECQDTFQVEQVLHPERFIQVVLGADTRLHGGVESTVATEGSDGITRHQIHHGEDQKCGAEENRNGLQQAAPDISRHKKGPRLGLQDGMHYNANTG